MCNLINSSSSSSSSNADGVGCQIFWKKALRRCMGDQGKLSHFAIKSTKKPMYQQILENEYCI